MGPCRFSRRFFAALVHLQCCLPSCMLFCVSLSLYFGGFCCKIRNLLRRQFVSRLCIYSRGFSMWLWFCGVISQPLFPIELNGSVATWSVALTHSMLQVPRCDFDLSVLFGFGFALRSFRFRFLCFTTLVFPFLGSFSHVSSWRAWIFVESFQRSRYYRCCVSQALFELVSGGGPRLCLVKDKWND